MSQWPAAQRPRASVRERGKKKNDKEQTRVTGLNRLFIRKLKNCLFIRKLQTACSYVFQCTPTHTGQTRTTHPLSHNTRMRTLTHTRKTRTHVPSLIHNKRERMGRSLSHTPQTHTPQTRTHSLSLSLSHHKLAPTHPHTLSLTHHKLAPTNHSLSLSPQTRTHSPTHSHTHHKLAPTHPLSLSLSLSHTHTITLTYWAFN